MRAVHAPVSERASQVVAWVAAAIVDQAGEVIEKFEACIGDALFQ